jgi:hypothetical protein
MMDELSQDQMTDAALDDGSQADLGRMVHGDDDFMDPESDFLAGVGRPVTPGRGKPMDEHDEDAAGDPPLEAGTEAAAHLGDAAKVKGDADFMESGSDF